jgi:hypothetical protein
MGSGAASFGTTLIREIARFTLSMNPTPLQNESNGPGYRRPTFDEKEGWKGTRCLFRLLGCYFRLIPFLHFFLRLKQNGNHQNDSPTISSLFVHSAAAFFGSSA